MIIETKRLILRKFTMNDIDDVFAFSSNKLVSQYTGDPAISAISEAEDIIRNIWLHEYETVGYARLAVVYKEHNKVIGFSGLKYEPEFGATDIGYRFLPQYWGKGIATESCVPILKSGFDDFNLSKVVAAAMPENIASCKVLEKIGMQFKGEKIVFDDVLCNWYELSKEDYYASLKTLS